MANVLFAHHDETMMRMGVRAINMASHTPYQARSGKEALDLIDGNSIDKIFLAVEIPEPNGLEVLKELKERGSTIPVVISSSIKGEHIEKDVNAVGYGHVEGYLGNGGTTVRDYLSKADHS